MSKFIKLPDTLSEWPWRSRRLNPYYEEVGKECTAWLASFGILGPKTQQVLEKGKFHLLAGLAYPSVKRGVLRAACDLMYIFFLIDDHTDISDAAGVQKVTGLIRDALSNPHQPRGRDEWLGEIVRQFWLRTKDLAPSPVQAYFITSFDYWLQSLVKQAQDRDKNRLRNVDNYFKFRRVNIGFEPSLAILEIDMNLSDEFRRHDTTQKLMHICCDILTIDNDIVSYSKEQSHNDDRHNIITIIMNQYGTDVQDALHWAAGYHAALVREFKETIQKEPQWGGVAAVDAQGYIDALGNWVYANALWSFESERYFGSRGAEIMDTRIIPLMPQAKAESIRL